MEPKNILKSLSLQLLPPSNQEQERLEPKKILRSKSTSQSQFNKTFLSLSLNKLERLGLVSFNG